MSRHPFTRSLLTLAAVGLLATTVAACGSKSEDSMGYSTSGRQRNAALTSFSARAATPVSVSASAFGLQALDENGYLYSWGTNWGEDVGYNLIPDLKEGATKFTSLSSGVFHSLALDDLGNMYGLGENPFGEATPPKLKDGATKFTTVEAGFSQSMALDDQNNMYLWGADAPWMDSGETRFEVPELKDGGTKFTQLSSGYYHNLALDDAGNLYVWGMPGVYSSYGFLDAPELKDGASKFTDISAGITASVALDDLGNIYFWGEDTSGDFKVPELKSGGTKFVDIDYMNLSVTALDDAGNLYVLSSILGVGSDVPELKNSGKKFVSISNGAFFNSALDDKNNIYVWGRESEMAGADVIPEVFLTTTPVMPIAMGGYQAYGIHEDGYIEKFDSSPDGYWPGGDGYTSVAAGYRHGLAINRSGTVITWGENLGGQLNAPEDLYNVRQVIGGYAYSAALTSEGEVIEWGSHSAPRGKLIEMPEGVKYKAIAGGLTHIIAITESGKVDAWGSNEYDKASPPAGLKNVIAAAANSICSAALKDDGNIVYWGLCPEEFSATTMVEGATAIAMTESTVIVLANGAIQSWGYENDYDGLLNVPSGEDFVAITAGMASAMAVDSDGNVSQWGWNMGYTVNLPSSFSGIEPREGEECPDCEYPDASMFTDEMLTEAGIFIREWLSEDQLKVLIQALGGTYSSTMSQADIQKLIDAATEAQRSAALTVVNQATQPVEVKTAVLPASQSPSTKVGTKITTKKAVTMLGLKKATKVSFVVPKKKSATCAISKTVVTASAPGTCTVQVKYTQKKKAKKSSLLLVIG